MKKLLILLFVAAGIVRAASVSVPSIANQPVTVTGDAVDVGFQFSWWADDYPQNSAPGRLDLMNSSGVLVARIVASNYRSGGVSIQISGDGRVDGVNSNVGRFSPNGTPADGYLEGVWHVTGLAPGAYQLRLWSWVTYDSDLMATGVWTDAYVVSVSEPAPPPPPPAVMFTLVVGSGSGGNVAGGGTFPAGTVAAVSAIPDAGWEFAGWSGDAGGMANPLTLTMDRDWNVQANFTSAGLSLSTGASGGGNVTPGGSYPYGTWVTVSAAPDPTHYFAGWTGDAGGAATSINVYMDRTKSVQATFSPKAGQVISFAGPGDQPVGATPVLTASSTAGLPVVMNVVSGPATLSGNVLTVTGSGTVTLQALQGGDAVTLPAAPVTVTFNALAAAARVRVQAVARTILRDARTTPAVNYVLGNP